WEVLDRNVVAEPAQLVGDVIDGLLLLGRPSLAQADIVGQIANPVEDPLAVRGRGCGGRGRRSRRFRWRRRRFDGNSRRRRWRGGFGATAASCSQQNADR